MDGLLSFLRDFAAFMGAQRRWWLLSVAAVLLAVALLIALTQGAAVAPVIYAPR